MPNYDFHKDHPIALRTEDEVAKILKQRGYEILGRCHDYRYDILTKAIDGALVKIEVKEDFLCRKTENVGLEFSCRNKPSGISRTEADVYIYKVHEPQKIEYYWITTLQLKDMVKNREYHRIVNGGDIGSNSMNYLFRLSVFKTKSRIL